jgi:hypothetical protein
MENSRLMTHDELLQELDAIVYFKTDPPAAYDCASTAPSTSPWRNLPFHTTGPTGSGSSPTQFPTQQPAIPLRDRICTSRGLPARTCTECLNPRS